MNVTDNSNAWHAPGFSHTSLSDLHGAQPRLNLFGHVSGGWIYGRWGAAITVSDTQGYMQYVKENGHAKYPEPLLVVPHAYAESLGKAVYPQSLYQAQVGRRSEYLPEWLK